MASLGAPVKGEGGQIDTGLLLGSLLAGTIFGSAAILGVLAMGPGFVGLVVAATVVGFLVGFNNGKALGDELSPVRNQSALTEQAEAGKRWQERPTRRRAA